MTSQLRVDKCVLPYRKLASVVTEQRRFHTMLDREPPRRMSWSGIHVRYWIRLVAFVKRIAPVNSYSPKLMGINLERFLFAAQIIKKTSCPKRKYATVNSAKNSAKSGEIQMLQVRFVEIFKNPFLSYCFTLIMKVLGNVGNSLPTTHPHSPEDFNLHKENYFATYFAVTCFRNCTTKFLVRI
jgi:hypothetical protein